VPDPRAVDLDGLGDEEWRKSLCQRALQKLQEEIKAEHYQDLHMIAIEGRSPSEVTQAPGRSRAQVYLIKHRAARGRLTLAECIEVGQALSAALECLHRANLIHRDVKPSNIIYVRARAKLADIGLVTVASHGYPDRTRCTADPQVEGTLRLGRLRPRGPPARRRKRDWPSRHPRR
jgi:serine/threonine protein kinase